MPLLLPVHGRDLYRQRHHLRTTHHLYLIMLWLLLLIIGCYLTAALFGFVANLLCGYEWDYPSTANIIGSILGTFVYVISMTSILC